MTSTRTLTDRAGSPSSVRVDPNPPPSIDEFRLAVDKRLDGLLAQESDRWCAVDKDLYRGFDVLRAFIENGGKRMRPAFAFWSFVGYGGDPLDPRLVDLGAALEMLHTFALVHDDVMDGSAVRRHAPTVHCSLQADHEQFGWSGERRRFGEGMAVLLGDLAFVYADFLTSSLPHSVRRCFHDMKVELHVGQYLDLWGAAQREQSIDRTTSVIRYKTAKYSVERPLHLGATLSGEGALHPESNRARCLTAYGLAVGEAFQLRDDLLGAYGDPQITGKPIGDDFRDGKQTLLVVLARAWARTEGRSVVRPSALATLDRLGAADLTDDDVGVLQQLLDVSGARARVEARIAMLTETAHEALSGAGLGSSAKIALRGLAEQAAWRSA